MSSPSKKYIPRSITKKLKQHLKQFPVLTLTGPRQSGKTTLLRKEFQEYEYYNLEDIEIRRFAEEDPRGFLQEAIKSKKKLIIDEAQRVPDLFSYIQVVVDENKIPGQFILSGSQNFLLLEKITQSLAGRVAVAHLMPLSLYEIHSAKVIKGENSLGKLIQLGGYPDVLLGKIERKSWYSNYIETYVERDVRQIVNVSDLNTFKTFLKMCAARSSQVLNLSSLGSDCGITHNTAKKWLSILETSFIIKLLPAFYKNYGKRLIKSPKLFFLDTGLLSALIQLNDDYQFHPMKGALFESLIYSEIIKATYNKGEREQVYFWNDKHKNEVDFIFENQLKVIALEAKSGSTIVPDYFKALANLEKNLASDFSNGCLIYGGDKEQTRSGFSVLPWQKLQKSETWLEEVIYS